MLGCFAALSALQGLQAQTPGLSYPVPLDEAHFPDEVFREYLMGRYIDGDNIDKNGDGQLSVEECGDVTAVGLKIENGLTYVTLTGVSSLKGIEYFYALDSLGFYDSFVTSLDVSRNTALTCLVCWGNELTSLDLSRNTALTVLNCSDNELTSLDLSRNTALTELWCSGNQLTSLDVSKNTALEVLQCSGNQLTSLDVSKNTALEVLQCSGNQLTSLDLSRNTALTELSCSDNQLTSLDLSRNTALTELSCSDNHLATLDLSQNGSLLSVNAERNYYEVSLEDGRNVDIAAIPGLEAGRMTDLQGGYIEGNTLHLDAEVLMYYYDYKCPSQEAPSGGYFSIATDNPAYHVPIDKEHFPDTVFRRYVTTYSDLDEDGQLSSVEIGIVTGINVSYQGIRDLRGIEHFTFLQSLDCSSNQLTSLDVSGCTALTDLSCDNNQLTSLDVSSCTALETLYCYDNQLMSLDVSSCTALETLNCYDNQLTSLNLSRNTALETLNCFDNQLMSLDVSSCTALETLYCYDNQLTSLNLSRNTALTYLYCNNNQLTSLDLSQNTDLRWLDCSDNLLTSLDLSQNTDLRWLDCSDNHLAALDLSQNSRLEDVNAERNYYEVSLDESGNVDIAAIPGLEADRMTDLQGGYIEGNTLHLDADILMYYYDYKRPNYYAPSGGYFYIATDNPTYHVPIDKEHFPDSAFRGYVATSFDRNEDGQLSSVEIRIVSDISVPDREIHDLRGIEHFTFLQSLDCSANNLTSLDLSKNTALTSLGCSYNQLTSLDLSRNTALTELWCSGNQLTSLDLSQNTDLRWLDCSDNLLTSLDLSGCTALTGLWCSDNTKLTSLDLSGCTALQTLDCSDNALLDLDVRSLLALRELDCSKNQLASLDLFRNANLVSIKADGNYREVLVNQDRQFDISTLPRFERARMEEIEGGSLQGDILTFHQDEVRYFYSYNNADPNLPLGEYFHLKAVQALVPGIAINDTTFPDAVFRGYIAENADTDKDSLLSESEIAGVTGLDVSGMGIQDLRGIGYFTALESLDCSDNELTSLDLSANTALQTLDAGGNRLDIVLDESNAFDMSSLPGFDMAKASDWTGSTRMGNRLTFTQQEVTYRYATGYSGSFEDASLQSVVFSLMADHDPSVAPERIVSIDEEHFPDSVFREYITAADMDADHWLDEDEIAGVTGIDVSDMGIQDLRGIGYFTALESLDCSDNELTSLDLSANTALQTLNAGGNRLDIVLDEDNVFDVSTLPGFNMAKASDWTGCTRMGNRLTFTQQEVTYAYATDYSGSAEDASLQSVSFSLFADRDPSVGNEAAADGKQGRVYAKDRTLFTEGISGEVSVFTAVGTLVYQGKDTRIPVHQAGTYIVRHGEQVWKILVM